MTRTPPLRFPLSPSPTNWFPKFIVEGKKPFTSEQAQLELKHNSKIEFFKEVDKLIAAAVASHAQENPDLDMFIRHYGFSRQAMFALFNGEQRPSNSLSEDGKLLARCSFEVFCCLKEHLIKGTAGSMDINDLYEYAKTEPPRGRRMANLLKTILQNGDNDKLIKPFIERAKRAAGITSFVKA